MPISVPDNPKILTTKYHNWRGVDYTNDPSNVWYRRSPNGLNMLPNLDGQPFKRNGWKIELTAQDFITASGVVGVSTVQQYKVDYFELGGTEYLWFYTSIGCFYYGDSLVFVDESYQIDDDKPYEYSIGITYAVGDYCIHEDNGTWKSYVCTTAIESPESWDSDKWDEVADDECVSSFPPAGASVDYSKSFFFEGGGRAGYYLFVNDKLFWFDGDKLHEAKPTIPVVLTMAEATGEGTLLEEVNMLTPWRAIDYVCDGTTAKYMITGGVEAILNVYTINEDGSFTPNYDWTMQNNGELDFGGNPPQPTRPNQPSMRVVYRSANATISEETVETAAYSVKVTKTTESTVTQTYTNGAWKDGITGYSTAVYANEKTATIPLVNAKKPVSIQVDTKAANLDSVQWEENVSTVDATVDAYGSKVEVKSKNNGKDLYDKYYGAAIAQNVAVGGVTTTESYIQEDSTHRIKVITTVRYVSPVVRLKYTQWNLSSSEPSTQRDAFFATSKVLVYGNGIINQVFLTASKYEAYSTRVWYSAATDPLYFPDTNYIEVGATDKKIMGLIKVDDYLGIVKQGGATDTSVYLAYATSFEDITTYAVKQSVNGVGAISNGAFNILNGEPLFLSAEGVMGIEPAEDESRVMRNRSYYINKKLLAEPSLESAFSFVFKGMYWLCVNDHCYVLDGSQKISWENTKTNLQYECYYLENIPAKCFAQKDSRLWFTDKQGNVCRFKSDSDDLPYVDGYSVGEPRLFIYNLGQSDTLYGISEATEVNEWTDELRSEFYSGKSIDAFVVEDHAWCNAYDVTNVEITVEVDGQTYYKGDLSHTFTPMYGDPLHATLTITGGDEFFETIADVEQSATYTMVYTYTEMMNYPFYPEGRPQIGDIVEKDGAHFTLMDIKSAVSFTLAEGVPIPARWGTIADDDGSAHYYKKLQKRGSMVAVMPMSDSGVRVSLIPDEKEPIFVGETDIGSHILPFNYYLRKKVKNYKRLQIVCENATYNDGFGIDEIIKSYTVGNYAKR